jgi:hypothetical protein
MSLFQGDVIIKTAVELGIEDLRKNPWLISHMLSDLVDIRYVKEKYGQAQIDACKEWLANNNIDIYMRDVRDKDRLPCVTIGVDASNEKVDMKFMADQSTKDVVLLPQEINKPLPYMVPPFVPTGYNMATGEISVPDSVPLTIVIAGMILVNPENGQGFEILGVTDDAILIEPNLAFEASQLGVLPHFRYYKARVEHTFFQESYAIGCHAHGDAQNAIWLHNIVLYSLLRYRESLLEANGFAESVINNFPLQPNPNYSGPGGEEAWMRRITLTGQVENSWVKSPRRFIEVATFSKKVDNEYIGGIRILGNLNNNNNIIPEDENIWYTAEDTTTSPPHHHHDDNEDE